MPNSALETCLRNQAECAAYRGPDMEGAWAGLCDWVMEECLITMAEAERLRKEDEAYR